MFALLCLTSKINILSPQSVGLANYTGMRGAPSVVEIHKKKIFELKNRLNASGIDL
jgi:hypothetical protein